MPIVAERVPRQIGWREVLVVAAIVVAVVLVVAQVTSGVSRDIRTPATIVVLVAGTAWVLWRITRRQPDA
jgi:hypothetical protein